MIGLTSTYKLWAMLAILLFPGMTLAGGIPSGAMLGHAMPDAELQQERGMANIPMDLRALQNATSSGNSVVSSTNIGSNSIQGAAFGNASGIVNVIQNMGNNVIIQNAVIINVHMM